MNLLFQWLYNYCSFKAAKQPKSLFSTTELFQLLNTPASSSASSTTAVMMSTMEMKTTVDPSPVVASALDTSKQQIDASADQNHDAAQYFIFQNKPTTY